MVQRPTGKGGTYHRETVETSSGRIVGRNNEVCQMETQHHLENSHGLSYRYRYRGSLLLSFIVVEERTASSERCPIETLHSFVQLTDGW